MVPTSLSNLLVRNQRITVWYVLCLNTYQIVPTFPCTLGDEGPTNRTVIWAILCSELSKKTTICFFFIFRYFGNQLQNQWKTYRRNCDSFTQKWNCLRNKLLRVSQRFLRLRGPVPDAPVQVWLQLVRKWTHYMVLWRK